MKMKSTVTPNPQKPHLHDTKNGSITWINYVLDNLYVQVGDQLLRQVIGIPMGVSCAPYLANLMLFMYELEFFDAFISKHDPIRNKPARQLLWKLSCCTRYIDDLWNPLVTKEKFQSFTRRIPNMAAAGGTRIRRQNS